MIQIQIPTKTYASAVSAEKAARAKFDSADLRYLIACAPDGRFFPVFIGQAAVQAMVHFHFSVVA